ncbi:MAG: DUF4112 domain-containing protein [Gemmatimonadetes bacterium]|nr:DUF4112 domain-containing protein [Gemmatimonadota bacterium]
MPPTPPPAPLQRLRVLSHLLDDSLRVPGTGFRFGLDALIGLVPGIGDASGAALSAYVLVEAGRLGAPKATLLRMAGNVALEASVGTVPVVGDLFDAGWKANLRNLRLLEAHLANPAGTERASRGWILGVAVGVVLMLVASAVVAGWILVSIGRAIF